MNDQIKLEQLTNIERKILREIGFYFYEKANYDLKASINNLSKIDIKYIKYENNNIYILMSRPGLLIGYKGEDINNIKSILEEKLNNDDLHIYVEGSNINNHLYYLDLLFS